jgi:hypothetical protein
MLPPPCTPQKKKGTKKKGGIEVGKPTQFHKLNDDEKNDLISLEVELVQTEIEQVSNRTRNRALVIEPLHPNPLITSRTCPPLSSSKQETRTLMISAL